jgi:hypothetical protein
MQPVAETEFESLARDIVLTVIRAPLINKFDVPKDLIGSPDSARSSPVVADEPKFALTGYRLIPATCTITNTMTRLQS